MKGSDLVQLIHTAILKTYDCAFYLPSKSGGGMQ